jgi:hypothetical protein
MSRRGRKTWLSGIVRGGNKVAAMLDQILSWMVVILPTLFAVGIEIVSRGIKERPYWRVAVIAFGLGLSSLTWLQMSRANKAASIDRQTAIIETSRQVSAEVSKSVTKTVTDQYANLVADQKRQIGELQHQIALQGKDVSAIKSSDIVSGKHPVKVEVTNEGGSRTHLEVENVRLFSEPETSSHADAPYAVKVTLQSDAPISPLRLAIFCDKTLKYGEIGYGAGISWYGGDEIYKNDSHVFIINATTNGGALLRPDSPVIVHLYSDSAFNVVKFTRAPK